MFARCVYSVAGALLLPLLFVYLWWRGRKNPGYRRHIGERFGCYRGTSSAPLRDAVWIHAVSVGETRAAAPLIAQIERQFPGVPIVLTHMTATGRATGRTLYGERVVQLWLPYDYRFAIRAFLKRIQPRLALLMETELWPHLVDECRRRTIPCFLVNARMSAHSAAAYARYPGLTRPMFAALSGVAAQSADDAARLTTLGANPATTIVTGNLKFDFTPPADTAARGRALRRCLGAQRPVWVFASTRDGEEALLLDALLAHRDRLPPDLLTFIVPRHPERFDAVAELLQKRQLHFARRSALRFETTHATENDSGDDPALPPETAVLLGDSMGELLIYYAAADLAFVGGSLLPFGGQNPLEPLAVGTPALIGPHTFNFADICEKAREQGALRTVADADELMRTAADLLRNADARAAMRAAGNRFLEEHRGATMRLMNWLESFSS